jgi:hypothetical protein
MCWEQNPIGVPRTVELQRLSEIVTTTATPRPRFDQWLLAQTDREDPVGNVPYAYARAMMALVRACAPARRVRIGSKKILGTVARWPR